MSLYLETSTLKPSPWIVDVNAENLNSKLSTLHPTPFALLNHQP